MLGAPGTGKSTYALARSLCLHRGAYVIAHDVGWNLPEHIPGQGTVPIRRHETIEECKAQLSTDPSGIHSIATDDASEVVQLSKDLTDASLEQHNGEKIVPCVLLVDEIVAAQGASPHWLDDSFRHLVAKRRHWRVAFIYTTQSPRLCHNQLLAQATELVIFRLNHQMDFDALARAGVPDEKLKAVKKLKDHQYVIYSLRNP